MPLPQPLPQPLPRPLPQPLPPKAPPTAPPTVHSPTPALVRSRAVCRRWFPPECGASAGVPLGPPKSWKVCLHKTRGSAAGAWGKTGTHAEGSALCPEREGPSAQSGAARALRRGWGHTICVRRGGGGSQAVPSLPQPLELGCGVRTCAPSAQAIAGGTGPCHTAHATLAPRTTANRRHMRSAFARAVLRGCGDRRAASPPHPLPPTTDRRWQMVGVQGSQGKLPQLR